MGGGGVNPQSLDSPLDYWAMTRHFVPDEFRVAEKPGQAPKVPGQRAEAVASADSLPVS